MHQKETFRLCTQSVKKSHAQKTNGLCEDLKKKSEKIDCGFLLLDDGSKFAGQTGARDSVAASNVSPGLFESGGVAKIVPIPRHVHAIGRGGREHD